MWSLTMKLMIQALAVLALAAPLAVAAEKKEYAKQGNAALL